MNADELVEALWGDDAPPTATKALQVTVSRLRRALGPAADRLETAGGGYRLRVEPGELDADRFEQACRRGGELPPREAAVVLREALALWRGPALADQRYEAWAQAEIRRLEDLRALAIEERVKADLALGEHARLVGELEALVAEHPHRERLRARRCSRCIAPAATPMRSPPTVTHAPPSTSWASSPGRTCARSSRRSSPMTRRWRRHRWLRLVSRPPLRHPLSAATMTARRPRRARRHTAAHAHRARWRREDPARDRGRARGRRPLRLTRLDLRCRTDPVPDLRRARGRACPGRNRS